MSRLLIPLLLFLLPSCVGSLTPYTPRYMRMQDRFSAYANPGGGDTPEEVPPEGPAVYISAIVFPSWADWRKGDFRDGRIVLFRNGKELISVPAGDNPDPERHRIRDGHIWQDDIEGKSTVILMDGEERFRYDAQERILGFAVREDGVHTLGQKPGSEGFSYRINGKEVFGGAGIVTGSLELRDWECGALQEGEDGLWYCYAVPVNTSEGEKMEYHLMCGGRSMKVLTPPLGGYIYDIKVKDGTLYRIERSTDLMSSTCLISGTEYSSLGIFQGEKPSDMHLALGNGRVCAKGLSSGISSKNYGYWSRSRDGIDFVVSSNYTIPDVYAFGESLAWLTVQGGRIVEGFIDHSPLPITPDTYYLATPLCADFTDGVFRVALSSARDEKNLLLEGREQVDFWFNGYFTSISVN